MKQLDIYVRYWNDINNCVQTSFWTSTFMGHARAADLLDAVMDALKLPLNKEANWANVYFT